MSSNINSNVYTVRARTDSQGALEDIILAALEHTEDGSYRYGLVEAPQEYVSTDLGNADFAEATAWAQRFAAEDGLNAWFENGAWKFERGENFEGRG